MDAESRDAFIEAGSTIASRHVLSDAPRILGTAYQFLTTAGADLVGRVDASLELVAVGVSKALELRALLANTHRTQSSDGVEMATAEKTARAAFEQAILLRDQTETLLRALAGRAEVLRSRIGDTAGTAETAEALAQGLEALAKQLRVFLADKTPALVQRVKLFKASEARAKLLDQTAALVRSTAQAADARAAAKVRQLEIDCLDGENLHILGELIRAFEAAHDAHAGIPRLIPIATRRLLGKRPKRDKAPAPQKETP